jgi:glycosyltransferase involved in cell wall biosynthesis
MRVLFVAPFYEPAWIYGGMMSSTYMRARFLAADGTEVAVWTTTANGARELDLPCGQPLIRDGVEVTYFPRWRWTGNRFVAPGLLRVCIQHTREYDVVHAVGLWTFPSWLAGLGARLAGKPYAVSVHGTLMPWAKQHHGHIKSIFFRLLERPRLARASVVICTSELEKRYFLELGLKNRVEIIPNVVDTADIRPRPEHFRLHYDLQTAFVFLFAGRLVENKGIALTLAAFAAIASAHPDTRLVIVGPSEDHSRDTLQQRVQEMGLSGRVIFTGLLAGQDYWDALSGSDVFVLNSYSENFGMAPAEALSLGVPVLLSDQVGIADLVTQYNAGWITPLQVDAISATMSHILTQRASLRETGQNGVRLVGERFAPQVVGIQWRQLLEEIKHEQSPQSPLGKG